MTPPAVFAYRLRLPRHGGPSFMMPVMPIRLGHGVTWVDADGLVDSRTTVNVLPFELGRQLGLDWASAPPVPLLGGVLARHPARGVVVEGLVAGFPQVRFGFAWSADPDATLLLGQMNFFDLFEVCFFVARAEFHVQPRTP